MLALGLPTALQARDPFRLIISKERAPASILIPRQPNQEDPIVDIRAKISNDSFNDYSNLTILFYVITDLGPQGSYPGRIDYLNKLRYGPFALKRGSTEELKVGTVSFVATAGVGSDQMQYRSGQKFDGWVVGIYAGTMRLQVVASSAKMVRKFGDEIPLELPPPEETER